jgi:glycosyltransferase involved in cell wall biosynthesis
VWPEPGSSAAGSRMLQLINIFQEQGWQVTFASAAADSEFAVDLSLIDVAKETVQLNNSSFDSFVKGLAPKIVMFDRFMTEEQFGWRVAENCPDALRILDTEDLHCLRSARQTAWKEKRAFNENDLLNDIAKREIASIYRCDLSLIISQYEMKLLKDFFKVNDALLMYLPFLLDEVKDDFIPFEERKNFISIGNFLHEPNWNTVLYLKEEIWPLIRKALPEAEINIYGAYPSPKVQQLNNPKEGFNIKGRADSAKEVIERSRVLLAPLRFGAGLKGKLIDAMLHGTPNVTTDIGAEAMHEGMEWPGIVTNDKNDFADAAVKLYQDNKLWQRSQNNGIKIINELFQKKDFDKNFVRTILEISENLVNHRRNNFTGQMLMHHTISASKYMSKWIEEKNKIQKP